MKEMKNRKVIIGLAIIILLISIVTTFGGRGELTFFDNFFGRNLVFVQRGLTVGSEFVGNILEPVVNIWRLNRTNQELEIENAELRRKLITATLSQKELKDLAELKEALNYFDEKAYTFLTCDVVAKDPGTWFNIFVINKGTADGVYSEQAVVNGDGLVGIVFEAGADWAKVVSVIDNKSSVSFKLLDEAYDGVGIVGGGIEKDMEGYLFDPKAEVSVGQAIITSGLGIYPEGILIGVVKNVIIEKNEPLKAIEVEPAVDFKQIDRVLVLLPREGMDRP